MDVPPMTRATVDLSHFDNAKTLTQPIRLSS